MAETTARVQQRELAIDGGQPTRVDSFGTLALLSRPMRLRRHRPSCAEGRRRRGARIREGVRRVGRFKYAIALTNGSVALELALYALDIGTGHDVIRRGG